jgi:hypothetical protein
MGTVVQFSPRAETATAKTEAILGKIAQLYQEKMKAKEALPPLLARLVVDGESNLVLKAVTLWGTGEMEAHEVLSMCQQALDEKATPAE